MKKIIAIVFAGLAATALSASAAELSDQDRAELRQRAQELQNERARNPDFQPGQGRSAAQPSEAGNRGSKRAVKKHASAKGEKETMRQKAARKARSIKKVPGAFVRGR